ncbi:MAG TPA: flagellin, partial [Chroococcales cyanobacterium]
KKRKPNQLTFMVLNKEEENMGLRINTNVGAINAHRNLVSNNESLSKSLEKLSSGFRINKASDDAAGLAISEKMRGQITGSNQAMQNAQDAISMLNTAEGALNETEALLQRMRTLTVQGASDTLTTSDRANIKSEIDQLSSEVDRIARNTEFNKTALLNGGSMQTGLNIQIGANAGQGMTVAINKMDSTCLSVNAIAVDTATNASTSLGSIDAAIATVSTERAKIGAYTNRLEHTINNLGVAAENLQAAESRVRDLDMAQEVSNMTRNQILTQSGTAMLAQANQAPQSVLSLLR